MTPSTRSKMDARVRETLRQIQEAFMALLIEKGFEATRVNDIVARAGINRSTFYRHYSDKYDLGERLTDFLFAEINKQMTTLMREDPTAVPQLLFEHVAEYASFYRAMLKPQGIPGFTERVREVVETQITAVLPITASDMGDIPTAVAVRYLSAAQVGLVQWWLETDMSIPPAEMAQYLIYLHTHGGTKALGLG